MALTRFIRAQHRDGTFTAQNNLAEALLVQPEIASTLTHALGAGAANNGTGDSYNVLQYLTAGAGAIADGSIKSKYKPMGSNEIMWPLMGKLQRSIPISGAVTPTNGNVGQGFARFTVPLAEKYFHRGWIVRFEDGTQARIESDPVRKGNDWCYDMVIHGSNPAEFIRPDALEEGREIGWIGSAYEEGSEGGGTVEATPEWYRNRMSISRYAMGMTGSSKTDIIVFQIKRNGKTHNLWLYEKQFQFMLNNNRALERMLWEGRYNEDAEGNFHSFGDNGRPVKTGAGIEEQIAGTNSIVTDRLNHDMFWHMLVDIASNNGQKDTHRVLLTGNGGNWEFQQAMRRAGQEYIVVDTNFIHKQTGNKLAFGAEYTTYKGPDGNKFTLINYPLFNDRSVYTATDAEHGYTLKSYEMYFLDFNDYDGEPNIQLMTKGANGENRHMVQWFTAGATTPNFDSYDGTTGDLKGTMRSHSMDGFMFYVLSECMILLRNPHACGRIKITKPRA